MLTNAEQLPITFSPNSAPQSTQPLSHLQDLTVHKHLHTRWDRAHIRSIQGAADAHHLPEAGLADKREDHGGAEIEKSGGSTAVEIAQTIGVFILNGEREGYRGVRESGICGDDFDAGYEAVNPSLVGESIFVSLSINCSLVSKR